MFYEVVFSTLEKHRVKYVVVGGVAVNLHGVPRMTADLDLLVELSPENLGRLLQAVEELGYRPQLPVPKEDLLNAVKRKEWAQQKNLRAFTFWNKDRPIEELDVLLEVPTPQVFQNAQALQMPGFTVHLISLDDLIAMKKSAGGKQDQADMDALQKLKSLEDES